MIARVLSFLSAMPARLRLRNVKCGIALQAEASLLQSF